MFLEEHSHVDWGVEDFAVDAEVVIGQYYRFRKVVFIALHYIGKRTMGYIILARLDLNRQYPTTQFDNKIEFATFLIIVIIWLNAMSNQFLSNRILLYRTKVNILIPFDDTQLDTFGILGCQ